MRIIVEEAVTGTIQSRDLEVTNAKLVANLSGPCQIEFTVPYGAESAEGISFKAFGQLIHWEDEDRTILATGVTQPTEVDQAGNLKVSAQGFSNYPKDLPWLDNWNPVVVDPFEVVQRVWDHVQSYTQGNMNVAITPASSGTFLLPGFSFDGTDLNVEFFAYFIRASDFRDCGDEINALARDIPFDYLETSEWNVDRTQINKSLVLAYPRRGYQRTDLAFRLGENVMQATPVPENEIQWVSDVIVRGWFPGKVYSSTFTNVDPVRFRRVIMEDDAQVNSNERSQVWAKRKLTRRQIPHYWSQIVIDPNHSNAQWGTWELGDDILVQGWMPWVGQVSAWHRIMSYTIDAGRASCTLSLMHEGAFNYDPIEFVE